MIMEKIKILITSLILTYILLTFILLVEIDKRNNVERSMQQYINDSYYLEIDNYIEKKVKLVQENKFIGKRGMKICEKVKEIAINDNYYVGYLEGGIGKECNKYFYINKLNQKNAVFGLNEESIKEKFGNEIKFNKPYSLLYKNESYIPIDDLFILISILKKIFLIAAAIIYVIVYKVIHIKRKFYINKKILNFMKIAAVAWSLSHIVYSSMLINDIIKRGYVINMGMGLNNYYKIEVKDFKNKTFSLIKNETSVKEKTICSEITKIIRIEDFYVGYLEKGNEEICGRYFYLNRYVDSDYKFGLAEREIYYKFGNIKYEKPEEYLKKYGEGGDLQGYVRYFSSVYGVIGLLIFIGGFIALNVLNYLIKKP